MLIHILKLLKVIAITTLGIIFLLGSGGGGSSSTSVQESKALITINNYYKSVEAINQLYIFSLPILDW